VHIYAFIDNTRTKSPRHRQIDTNIRTSKKERDQAKIERRSRHTKNPDKREGIERSGGHDSSGVVRRSIACRGGVKSIACGHATQHATTTASCAGACHDGSGWRHGQALVLIWPSGDNGIIGWWPCLRRRTSLQDMLDSTRLYDMQ